MANRFYKLLIVTILFFLSFNVYAEEVMVTTSEDSATITSSDITTSNEEDKTIVNKDEEEATSTSDNSALTTGEITENNEVIDQNINVRYQIIIEDDADLLTPEEESKLYDKMSPISEYGNVAFKTTNTNNSSIEVFADSYYHQKFNKESGTSFIIDMSNRKIYIFSDGAIYTTINSDKAYIITDNIYRYATAEEYYECASRAFEQILDLLEGRKISEPMRYVSNGVLAITIAAFINFFIVMFVSKTKEASANERIKKAKVNFQIGEIVARKTGQRRVYSPPSDSGSSSGGSSGGGGGGSSGGGGGHGF